MRIFIANGAPRENGYTRDVLKLFTEGIELAGGTPYHADLCASNIHPCRGCYGCLTNKHFGKCVLSDDMVELTERYIDSQIVVFATPIYFYSFSAQLKGFVERLLPLALPSMYGMSALGSADNPIENQFPGPSSSILIAVAGQRDPGIMEGVKKTFELISNSLNLKPSGTLLRNESFLLDFPAGRPRTNARIKAAFKKAGEELVTLGYISPETEDDASLPLTKDKESFERVTSIYWQTAAKTGENKLNRHEVRKKVSRDLNLLMPELASYIAPSSAKSWNAEFLFDLSGDQPGLWHLSVIGGNCVAKPQNCENPDVVIRTSSETLLDIIFQREDPRQLMAKGKMKLIGDKNSVRNLARLFSKPLED